MAAWQETHGDLLGKLGRVRCRIETPPGIHLTDPQEGIRSKSGDFVSAGLVSSLRSSDRKKTAKGPAIFPSLIAKTAALPELYCVLRSAHCLAIVRYGLQQKQGNEQGSSMSQAIRKESCFTLISIRLCGASFHPAHTFQVPRHRAVQPKNLSRWITYPHKLRPRALWNTIPKSELSGAGRTKPASKVAPRSGQSDGFVWSRVWRTEDVANKIGP